MRGAGIAGEVVVADNGSTDDSPAIASAEGARLVPVADRGYGAALMGGIDAARGRFVIMGDADDSYDFGEVPKFVERLREGYDLVQGCRLESGGGRVLPGAMPRLHRWFGNPMFSRIARRWFRAPVHDIYCGLRGFTKSLYYRLDQRCTGMEFATEMIIKASLSGARISEVPITLHPDGRKSHPPHLNTFRDGWRTLRFFLMCTPRRLFLLPGLILVVLGLAGYTVAMPGMTIGTHDVRRAHTPLLEPGGHLRKPEHAVRADRQDVRDHGRRAAARPAHQEVRAHSFARARIAAGLATVLLGVVMLLAAINEWRVRDFGRLDYAETMRVVVPGVTLAVLGYQTILACFFLSLLSMRRALKRLRSQLIAAWSRNSTTTPATTMPHSIRDSRCRVSPKEYFAHERVRWLAARLAHSACSRRASSTTAAAPAARVPHLLEELHARLVVGVDASGDSLDVARKTHADPRLCSGPETTCEPPGSSRSRTATVSSTTSSPPSASTRSATSTDRWPKAGTSASGRTTRGIPGRASSCGASRSIATRSSCRRHRRVRCSPARGSRCCGRTRSSSFRACCRCCGRSRPGSPVFLSARSTMVLCRKRTC